MCWYRSSRICRPWMACHDAASGGDRGLFAARAGVPCLLGGGIERFFGRVFLFFHLQRPPLYGWSALASQVALTYTATIIVALAAHRAGRPDLIRSPKRVLAHTWEAL